MPSVAHRYRAFISYSHDDKAVAGWLHRALESYVLPAKLVGSLTRFGPAPRRLTPIFRDRDELSASADLGGDLTAALEASLFLIVICSPAAARSHWVEQEILSFKEMHGEDRVLALIADGVPYSSSNGDPNAECFPRALRLRVGPSGELTDVPAEPIAADLRPSGDGRRLAKLKLASGLAGVPLDGLVQRETQRRMGRLVIVASASVAGMMFAGGLAIYADARRVEAERERAIAVRESTAARAASDFLVGAFALSNPATENPRTITALTILAHGAARARTQLARQPAIQARLIDTLGQAYNNLGLFAEARKAVEQSAPAIDLAGPDGAGARLTLATSYFQQGLFDQTLATVREAEAALGPDQDAFPEARARAAVIEGQVRASQGETPRGIAAYDRALALYRRASNVDPSKIATVLQNRGLLLSDDGQFAAAETSLLQALAIDARAAGDRHLFTGQVWFALGQNAFLADNLPLAEKRIARALEIEHGMLDSDNPMRADALSMRGQIYQAEHRDAEAERSLRQAVAIYRKAFGKPHYQIGITEVYLGLVQADLGQTAAALATLDDAKHNYDVGYGKLHANHGDLLVNRATILAHVGCKAEAHADCAAGLAILARTLGPDANYTHTMAATCAKL